jgi:Fe-S cluster assembly ATPase SufC
MDCFRTSQKFLLHAISINVLRSEDKRCEIFQLFMLQSLFIMFDKIDSGVDIDILKLVGDNKGHPIFSRNSTTG